MALASTWSRFMCTLKSRIIGLLPILLLVAASFPLASLRMSSRADRERNETNGRRHEREESPPEDSFITQRVAHGGIPVGALEKASAQADALTLATRQSHPQLATIPWQFVWPTNIWGRVVDIAVFP